MSPLGPDSDDPLVRVAFSVGFIVGGVLTALVVGALARIF